MMNGVILSNAKAPDNGFKTLVDLPIMNVTASVITVQIACCLEVGLGGVTFSF